MESLEFELSHTKFGDKFPNPVESNGCRLVLTPTSFNKDTNLIIGTSELRHTGVDRSYCVDETAENIYALYNLDNEEIKLSQFSVPAINGGERQDSLPQFPDYIAFNTISSNNNQQQTDFFCDNSSKATTVDKLKKSIRNRISSTRNLPQVFKAKTSKSQIPNMRKNTGKKSPRYQSSRSKPTAREKLAEYRSRKAVLLKKNRYSLTAETIHHSPYGQQNVFFPGNCSINQYSHDNYQLQSQPNNISFSCQKESNFQYSHYSFHGSQPAPDCVFSNLGSVAMPVANCTGSLSCNYPQSSLEEIHQNYAKPIVANTSDVTQYSLCVLPQNMHLESQELEVVGATNNEELSPSPSYTTYTSLADPMSTNGNGIYYSPTGCAYQAITVKDMIDCVFRGDVEQLKFFLSSNPHLLNFLDETGKAGIHHAVEQSQTEIINFLIASQADLTLETSDGRTTLHLAAQLSSSCILEQLLQCIDLQSLMKIIREPLFNNCFTPLHVAARCKQADNIYILLRYGANCLLMDQNGLSALHIAVQDGDVKSVETIINFIKNPKFEARISAHFLNEGNRNCLPTLSEVTSQPGYNHYTALHFSADVLCRDVLCGNSLEALCQQQIIKLLISNEADISAKNSDGYVPYDLLPPQQTSEAVNDIYQMFHHLGQFSRNEISTSLIYPQQHHASSTFELDRFVCSQTE